MGQKKQIYAYDFSGGLVISKLPHKLKDNQSPNLLNMLPFDENGIMMRTGQAYLTEQAASGSIRSIFEEPFEGYLVFAGEQDGAHALFTCLEQEDPPVYRQLYPLAGESDGAFFTFDNILYYINGSEYLKITKDEDASALSVQPVSGYVPITYINGYATGTNFSAAEAFNQLTCLYRVQYIPDGTATSFTLPHPVLEEDYSKIKAYQLSPARTELRNFKVSTANGATSVTFPTPPSANAYYMGGNTLEITAPTEIEEEATERQKVTGCTICAEYGGSLGGVDSGTRIFLSGNQTYPGSVFWSGVISASYNAAEYFPDVNVEVIGDAKKKITALAKQQNELIIFKERSVHALTYQFDGSDAHFLVRELHGSIGCDAPRSVQLINNSLCFAHSKEGVCLLISTNNNDERSIVPISSNINHTENSSERVVGLLDYDPARLQSAVSFDDGRRYWLCLAPVVFLWDYSISPYTALSNPSAAQDRLSWWLLDNFDACCFATLRGLTLYGSGSKLDFVRPSPEYSDFGERIRAFYKTKGYDGGDPTIWKNFKQIIFSQKTSRMGQAVFRYASDYTDVTGEKKTTASFSISDFAFDRFTFSVVNYGAIHSIYPQLEHTAYFSWQVENGEIGSDLFLTDVKTIFYPQHQDY